MVSRVLSRARSIATVFLGIFLLHACAGLQANFQMPTVKIISLQPLANNGIEQRFKIDLRVENRNAMALSLVGMTYALELEGFKVISGVANNLPRIAAYGSEVVSIEASINLLEGFKFFSSVFSQPKSQLSYRLSTKLDTGLPILGVLTVEDTGVVSLSNL